MDSKSYRFATIACRVYNRETKAMYYSHQRDIVFLITESSFMVMKLLEDGSLDMTPLADSSNSVLMNSARWRDENNTDIYEGDVVFTRRLMAGRKMFPICGIVNVKDFSFSINSGVSRFMLDYGDKNTQVLGNIFESSDENLAEKAKELFQKYSDKKA